LRRRVIFAFFVDIPFALHKSSQTLADTRH